MEDPSRSRPVSPVQHGCNICTCGRVLVCKGNGQSNTSFLYDNALCSDVTIELKDGTKLHAHSLILSPWSSVISTTLLGNGIKFKEGSSRILTMITHRPSVVRMTFKIVYNLPHYRQGMISAGDAFDVFDFAHAYAITSVQNLCVGEINKVLTDTGESMEVTDGIKYVEMIRNVLNRWIPFYDESMCPTETIEILGELITQVMTSVRMNIVRWMEHKFSDKIGNEYKLSYTLVMGLTVDAMRFLLTYDDLDIDEIRLIELYLLWIYLRYGSIVKNDRGGVTEITPKEDMKATDEEVELLGCIRWGNIGPAEILQLYNTIVGKSKSVESKCIPPSILERFTNIMLEATLIKTVGNVEAQYVCSSVTKKRKASNRTSPKKKACKSRRATDDSQ